MGKESVTDGVNVMKGILHYSVLCMEVSMKPTHCSAQLIYTNMRNREDKICLGNNKDVRGWEHGSRSTLEL